MGLDMYLERDIYIGGNYAHNNITGVIDLYRKGEPINIDLKKVTDITEQVGYWRKANAIHNWFVQNCQDGKDECQRTEVAYEHLLELKALCQKTLNEQNSELLPPVGGFFFGSTEIDQGYWDDLKDTINIIDGCPPDGYYYYQASW